MRKTLLSIPFLFISLLLMGQSTLQNHVCNIAGTAVDVKELRTVSKLPFSDKLYSHLDELNQLFNQPYAKYTLLNVKNHKVAAAHVQLIGHDFARVILLNKNYYTSQLLKQSNKDALFTWILAHELTHHLNGDLHYDVDGIIANNFKKELLADEQAGYAVGKLTNVDISFFDEELPRILNSRLESETHPIVKYRIIAAKAGWLKARLDDQDWLNSCSKIYKKQKKNETIIIGRFYDDHFNGISYIKYKHNHQYFGNCKKGKKNGQGIYFSFDSSGVSKVFMGLWKNDEKEGEGLELSTCGDAFNGYWKNDKKSGKGKMSWSNGDYYQGLWLNNLPHGKGFFVWNSCNSYNGDWLAGYRNGYGIYTSTNGIKYRGHWKNDKKHGDGILYKGNKTIKAGCWQNDVYIGTECK